MISHSDDNQAYISEAFNSTSRWEAQWRGLRASDSGARGRGFNPHSGCRVVSLSKIHLTP